MLEDFAMERKSAGRSVQTPGKGNGTELKKNQAELAGTSKFYPRTVRRREPCTFPGPRNDAGRKPTPQKNRTLDKRPRNKGQSSNVTKEDSKVVGDALDEYDSVHVTGNVKQNLNHLLNFHYAPRESAATVHSGWRSNKGSWGRRSITTHKHKYHKEQFLQANCQFVVRQANDYTECMANPDVLVDWDFIEQINFKTAETLVCPICLYPPVAAKMTRCGHIFCWSCILHYLALSDKRYRKCPICYELVEKVDLKSVVIIKYTQHAVGDEITLRLMRRERGGLLAVPVGETRHQKNRLLSVSEKEFATSFSKLLVATPKEVLSIISRERNELEVHLITELDRPERCFTEQAMEMLKERELPLSKVSFFDQPIPLKNNFLEDEGSEDRHVVHAVQEKRSVMVYQSYWDDKFTIESSGIHDPDHPPMETNKGEIESNLLEANTDHSNVDNRQRFESVSSEGFGSEDGVFGISAEDVQQSVSTSNTLPQKHFFFYQADDGQHVYLHAVNVRMLEHQFGSLEKCPEILTGRIVEKETGSMTEELRNRLRYLQHLPVTCQFEVVELELKQPFVSRSTLNFFQDQLEARRRRRQRRARDERRREKRIHEEEKRRMGRYPSPSICLQSHSQFPLYGIDADSFACGLSSSPPSASIIDNSATEHEIASVLDNMSIKDSGHTCMEELTDSASGPSFAQMLREGKSKGLVAISPEHGKPAQMKIPSRSQCSQYNSSDEQDFEGHSPTPQFLSDAISQAMEKAAACKASSQGELDSGKKKKKKKPKVLFATGMNFNSS